MERFLESCSTSVEEVIYAQKNGANRIELCEQLEVGGVTPSHELLKEVMKVATIPVNVLIRPRGGNFVFSLLEVQQMIDSILICRKIGVNGVVIGALTPKGDVDIPVMRRLVEAAQPGPDDPHRLSITFHRAFDRVADAQRALEEVISLGCNRLLTSGTAPDAYTGRFIIADLVKQAAGRIVIMPGCGVRKSNIEEIALCTGAPEFHASHSFYK